MNQFTKGLVIVSTLTAAFAQLYLATRLLYPQLFFIITAAFLVVAVVGAWRPGPITAAVLALSYLAPAAYVVWAGFENYSFEIVWSLPLLGLIVSGRDGWRWHLPQRWRWPIASWALMVAVSWPLVALRELDFYIGILPLRGVANTSIGITPWDAALAISYWALVHNIGLLWFDRLFGWYSLNVSAFRTAVLLPLAAAVSAACAVGAYQGFFDLRFLNPHLWPHMGRAAGTLGDANTFGMIAALWGPASVVLARPWPAPWSIVGAGVGIAISLIGVLTSGSRTALVVVAIGLAVVALESALAWRRAAPSTRLPLRRVLPPLAGAVILGVAVLVLARGSIVTSVIDRGSLSYVPIIGDRGIASSIRDLFWDRYGYGPPAIQMVREHPVAGTGVGTFHTLVHDTAKAMSGKDLDPDNAQSWYRHHLAELGLVGSLPWLAWCFVFASALLFRGGDGDRFSIGVFRGLLLAFGFASLMAMPGQSLPVALTFWTFAFWFTTLRTAPETASAPWSRVTWGVTLVLVALHAGMTLVSAQGDLRPRERAIRFGWDYRYGIGNLEGSPDGTPGRRTTTNVRSLSIVPVQGQVLKFVGWLDHPDADERPVHVRVWADSVLVYDDDLKRSAAIFKDIAATAGQSHMVVETEVSRLFRPRDFGRDDPRELGLSIRDWIWE